MAAVLAGGAAHRKKIKNVRNGNLDIIKYKFHYVDMVCQSYTNGYQKYCNSCLIAVQWIFIPQVM
jgi:hypothetical protein